MNVNSGPYIEFRPSERKDILARHGVIAFLSGAGVVLSVVFILSSTIGWLFDVRSLIFLDPICGFPLALTFALVALIAGSGFIVSSADGIIDDQGITTYILGFRYQFPWPLLGTATASRYKALPYMFEFQPGKDDDIFLIYVDKLPIIHRFAAWYYSLIYERPFRPLFVITPKYEGYDDFVRRIKQMKGNT